MKKLFAIIFSLIMVLASVSMCYAVQVLVIDPYSGEIVNQDEDADVVSINDKIYLSGNCMYDTNERKFLYTTGPRNDIEVRSNVCDGMIVTDAAEIYASDESQIAVYYEGEEVPADSYSSLQDLGVYIVRNVNQDVEIFRFTIVNNITGAIDSYTIPSIFYITEAYFNGQKMEVAGNTVNMSDDGEYSINYACDKVGRTYELDVTIDHVSPSLVINGLNEKGYAHSTVTFGETEANSSLTVLRDGEVVSLTSEYKDAGDYKVIYADEAGNAVTYFFTIRFFLDGGGWMYVGMVILLAAGALFYMKYSKKNIRTY